MDCAMADGFKHEHKIKRRSISSLPPQVWEEMGRFAGKHNRTRNAIIVALLTEWVRQETVQEAFEETLKQRGIDSGG